MDHTAYKEAKKKLADLLKDVEKIEHFLISYRDIYPEVESKQHRNLLWTHEESINNPEFAQKKNINKRRAVNLSSDEPEPRQNTSPERIIQLATQMLEERGFPMHRGQLLKALLDKGAIINGKDPAKVLGTTLWRSEKFESIEGLGYWPKALPKGAEWWDLL